MASLLGRGVFLGFGTAWKSAGGGGAFQQKNERVFLLLRAGLLSRPHAGSAGSLRAVLEEATRQTQPTGPVLVEAAPRWLREPLPLDARP